MESVEIEGGVESARLVLAGGSAWWFWLMVARGGFGWLVARGWQPAVGSARWFWVETR